MRRHPPAPQPERVTPAAGLREPPVLTTARARRRGGCRARRPPPRRARTGRSTSSRITAPATIVGARSGCSPGTCGAARAQLRPARRGSARASSTVSHVPVDLPRVVGLEPLRDRRRARSPCPRPRSPARTARRRSAGTPSSEDRRGRRRASSSSSRCSRRVGVDVALGLAHDAGLVGDVELGLAAGADHELGRAAADVDHERRRACRRGRARWWRRGTSAAPPRRRSARAARGRSDRARRRRTRRRWPRRAPRSSAPRPRDRPRAASISDAVVVERRVDALASRRRCSRPSASTPAPSRVTVAAPLELGGRRARPSTSAISSRVEFVPMSTTATASSAAHLVGHRPPVERRRAGSRPRARPSARGRRGWPSRCAGRRSGSARSAAGRRPAAARGR